MKPDPRSAAEIFGRALEFKPEERSVFLDGACGNDTSLRRRVEALLAAHEQQSGFLPDHDTVEEQGGPGGHRSVDAPTSQGTAGAVPSKVAPSTVASSTTEGPGAVIGRYRLLEKLGEGGFGSVWAAEQREPVKRRVALKIIKLGMDTRQVVARFEAERQALALMDHPNIAKVLDAGAVGVPLSSADFPVGSRAVQAEPGGAGWKTGVTGRPYFVMELVKGIPITKYCDQEQLGTKERLDLFIKVCHAIQHAHQKGIIHRDIKPSNILVTLHDGVPVPKVIDFGIAKATQQELTELTIYTQHHQFIGTPAYMSPEQAEMSGLDIDTRSDIYSLGVLLYELLTGSTPFDTKELMQSGIDEMRRIIREKEPVRPSTRLSQTLVAPDGSPRQTIASRAVPGREGVSADSRRRLHELRGDLDWIVMKCLEKDRTRRYETANGLAADLRRYLDNEPVVARPPSATYRFQKAWRRHRVLYSAGIAVAVAMVAGVVGTSVGLVRADRERANAESAARREREANLEAQDAGRRAQANAGQLETNLYLKSIALAHREITSQPPNVKQAEQLLTNCPSNLRNWEWHYLKRRRYQTPLELRELGDQKAHCVAFSMDGRHLAAGGGDGTVRIWDLAVPHLVQTLSNLRGYVASVAFSPVNPDWIASAGADNRLRLWEWRTGREIRSWPTTMAKDYGLAYAVAFSPDGGRLAAPGPESKGDFVVYNTESGDVELTLPGHEEGARCVAFSPDGAWIASGSGQGSVRLCEASTGRLVEALAGKGPPIGGVAFLRDPLRLVALRFDGTIKIWDVVTRRETTSYLIRQAGSPIVGLAVHPNGERVVTAGMDRLVTLSEPATRQQVLVFRDLLSNCYGLAFSPDGHRLAAASRSGSVFVWDARPLDGTEDRSFRTLHYPGDEVWSLDVSPSGRSIAVGGGFFSISKPRAPITLTELPGFNSQGEFFGYGIIVWGLAYDAGGRFLASSGDEPAPEGRAKLKVWNVETKKEAFPVEAFKPDERFFSVTFSRDGRWMVAGGNERQLRVWSASTGRKVGTLGEHANEITKLALSPDGRHLASIGNDDVVKLWDGNRLDAAQTSPRQFDGLCTGFTDSIAFSADSRRLAIVTGDDEAVVHDLEGVDRAVPLASPNHRPLAVAFSPDGRHAASGGVDCTVRIWDATTGSLQHTLRSHIDHVTRLLFLKRPEGVWLISGSRDGTVKFWDMGSLGNQPDAP